MSNSFQTRKGTSNLGKEYEERNVANIILKAVTNKDIEDFTLSTDDDDFGSFDDIVFEAIGTEVNYKYAIQLKHFNDNNKALNQSSLVQDRGNFAIVKYFQSYKKLCELGYSHKLILFTNGKFDNQNGTIIKFEKQQFTVQLSKIQNIDELINSSKAGGNCYKFRNIESTVAKTLTTEQQKYKEFFEKFYLYTNQANDFQMKNSVSTRFQETFSCSELAFDRYMKFLSNWKKLEGKKEKLNQRQMKRVITLCVLSHLIKPLAFTPVNTKVLLLQKAISEFKITVFEKKSYPLVCQIWGNKKCELANKLKDINKLITTYQLNFNHVKDLSELNDENCTQILWLMGICPLIVSTSLSTHEIIQLCHQEKFIVLGSHKEDQLSDRSVFQNLSDLFFKFEMQYEDIVTSFKYSLQGKQELSLKSLIEENRNFQKFVATDDLVKMLGGTYVIGGGQESFNFPYIDRSLTLNIIDFEFLKKIDKDTIVVIDSISKDKTYDWLRNFNLIEMEDFLQRRPLSTTVTTIDRNVEITDSAFKPDLYFTENICSEESFKTICEVKFFTKQHHIRLNKIGGLQWIRSLSDTDDLEPFRVEQDFIAETELCFIENRINLIVGEPGMGKSILMKSLKNKFASAYFTIIFYTEDISLFLNFKEKHNSMTNNLEEYILHEKFKNMEKFEKKMLLMLMRKYQVIYVWDGLDELSDPDIQLITDIIHELHKKNFCQWITCRCHLKNYLEQKFNVFSKTIIQFSEDQQSLYIQERMKKASYTKETINNTIQKIKKLIVHHEILGIPLQIFMLTEIFLKNPDKYSNLSKDIFNIIDLYERFIEEKFDIYYTKLYFKDYPLEIHWREEHKQEHRDARIKKYQKAALKTLIPSMVKEINDCNKFLEKIKQKHDPVGIITQVTDENIAYFIHKSFAEYFVAKYFFKQYEFNNRPDRFETILFENVNRNIRFFFDLLLARDSPAHVAVLYKSIESLKRYNDELKHLKDLGKRNVLHIACSWGQEYPPFNVHKKNEFYIIDTSNQNEYLITKEDPKYVKMLHYLLDVCNFLETDELFNYTSLTYAEKTNSLFAKAIILEKNNQKISQFRQNDNMAGVLYYSAKFGYTDVINLYNSFPLIKTDDDSTYLHVAVCQKNFVLELLKMDVYRKIINYRDANGLTPLSKACCEGQYEVVKFLTICNANINLTCRDGRTALHYASQFGHGEIVLWLIKDGADFNVKDNKGWTPLHWTCYNGHINVVDILLKKRVTSDIANDKGWTPLHLACINGHHKIVELLVESGVRVDIHRNANGSTDLDWTPLHSACWYGHENTVEVLMNSGADIDHKTKNGKTALHYACEKGHLKTIQLLCKHSPVINVAADEGWRPIHFACNNGNYAIVKLLIKVGCNINVPNVEGCTPLHLASYKGHNKVVELLINKRANIEAESNDGRRAIHYASQVGNDETVKLLLKYECQVNAADANGLTPLHLSCSRNQEKVVMLLAQEGADINAVTNKGKTALHVACQLGNHEIVKILLQFKCDFNIDDHKGIKPIHVACYNGHETIIRLLMPKSNIDVSNHDGWTPLHYACHGRHITVAAILISAKASINRKTISDGWTTLHIACQHGLDGIARLVLDAGIDVNIQSNTGRTPLHVACENNHYKVAWLLITSKANINSSDETGYTPLHVACEEGHLDIIDLLVTSKADINAPTNMGWTGLHLTSINGNADVCQRLLKYHTYIDVNAVDCETKTPFYLACQYGHESIFNLLVKAGAHISIKAKDGTTALHIACQYRRQKIVQRVLKMIKRIDHQSINVEDFEGCTPLHLACEIGDYKIVDLLVRFQVDVNVKDRRNYTPLHIACDCGHEKIVILLLKAGANIKVYTINDETPLYLAAQNGHQQIMSLLKSHINKKVCCRIT